MKKVVITCGLIAGVIGSTFMGIGVDFFEKNHTGITQVIGYTSLLLSTALIIAGIKIFRDKHNGGVISFGKAFRVGLYISLISSTLCVIAWALEYKFIFPDFLDHYSAVAIAKTEASGAGPEEMAEQLESLATYRELYKSPLFFILITYAQFLPEGLIVSLITALVMKRRNSKKNSCSPLSC